MAMSFNGISGEVNAGADASISNNWDGGGTLTGWIYPVGWGGGGFGRVAEKATSSIGWYAYMESGQFGFAHKFSTINGYWDAPGSSIALNTWTHIAIDYDSDSSSNAPKFYIGAELVATTVGSAPSGTRYADAGVDMLVGNRPTGTRAFDGRIADIRLYPRSLSAAEISTMYTSRGHDGNVRDLALRYSFFGADGVSPSTVFDLSGNGNTGTVTTATYASDLLSLGRRIR